MTAFIFMMIGLCQAILGAVRRGEVMVLLGGGVGVS